MTTFPDLAAYEDEATTEPLVLPINGKQYSFSASIPMARGIHIMRLREEMRRADKARQAGETYEPRRDLDLNDTEEVDLYLDLIGDEQRAAMEADGVSFQQMTHVGATLFAWHLVGRDMALRVWTRGRLEDDDVRPPEQEGSESSDPPKTSPSSSTKAKTKPSATSRGRRSRGATTSSGGGSSKRTSTASTA